MTTQEANTLACTACGTVLPLEELDLGETFAACSDDCLMAIQDAEFTSATVWQRGDDRYREFVSIREDGTMRWATTTGDSGDFPPCAWNPTLSGWSYLSALDYEPVPAEELYDAAQVLA